eukprot:7487539-Ditylum_brightwellii.AAC.1
MYQFENEHTHYTSRDCETERIVECAKLLLSANPGLITIPSLTTKCTPLHKALIYYGEVTDLVKLLLQYDVDSAQLRMRNRFGDLPIHVATTVGVPNETLRLIIERTVAATTTPSLHQDLPIANRSTLIWSSNDNGFTPIYLSWMRHIEGGGSYPQRRRTGGGLYNSLWKEAKKQLFVDLENLSSSLEREAAIRLVLTRTLGSFWDVAITLLRATSFETSVPVGYEENHKREPIRNVFQPLHIALALTRTNPEASLSFSILDVLLLAYRHQFHDRDEHGRLPLHYAAASYEYSTMPWNENDMEEDRVRLPVKVWNRLPTGWSEMVRREDDKLRTGAPVKKRNS